MSTEAKLWIISIPGLDDRCSAPTYGIAQLMKAHHDKCVMELLAIQHANGKMLAIHAEDVMAVIEECDDPVEYAELLAHFSYSDWGITDDELRNSVDPAQPTLFDQNGEKA